MLRTAEVETVDSMRALLILGLVLAACTTQPNAAPSPTPVATTPAPAAPPAAFSPAGSPNAAPLIYRTGDGGQTGTKSMPPPDPPGQTSRGAGFVLNPGRPRAFGSNVLVDAVFDAEQMRYVYRSTDGGATFTYT